MNNLQNVIFLMLPFRSHFTASFSYAAYLKSKGVNVIYAGGPMFSELILSQSFQFEDFGYLYEYKIKNIKVFIGLLIQSLFNRRFVFYNYRQFYYAYQQCASLITKHHPYEVYVDEGFSEYYWFFKALGVPVKLINTSLSNAKVKGVPPVNSGFKPQNNVWSDVICELIWLIKKVRLKLKEFVFKVAFVGCDEVFFWKRFCRARGWNWKKSMDWNRSYFRCVRNVETIIMAPELLEYRWRQKQINESYFHTRISRNEDRYFSERYLAIINEIKARKSDPDFRVIYCTFGTQMDLNRNTETGFLSKLMTVVRNEPNWLLVISTDNNAFQNFDAGNVRVLPFLPNIHFFNYTDLVISHGGLGTIKECLDASVPMIIYPLNLTTDQVGNAKKIEHLGMGLSGNFRTATPGSIRSKIRQMVHRRILSRSLKNECFQSERLVLNGYNA